MHIERKKEYCDLQQQTQWYSKTIPSNLKLWSSDLKYEARAGNVISTTSRLTSLRANQHGRDAHLYRNILLLDFQYLVPTGYRLVDVQRYARAIDDGRRETIVHDQRCFLHVDLREKN